MEWVETTGRTIEEALEAALDQLGVDETDAEYEVITEPKTGLFGRLRAEARIRARVRPTAPRPKDGGQRKRRERGGRDRDRAPKQGAPRAKQSGKPASAPADAEQEERRDSQDRPARSRGNQQARRPKPARSMNEGVEEVDEEVALDRQGDVAEEFLSGLLAQIQAEGQIDVSVDEDEELVKLAIAGDQLGHLIGPRGATLQAVQELTRTVVQRKTGARQGRLVVDVAEYRAKRREALARFVVQVAEDVKAQGVKRALEPMNPADRKVVHDVVNDLAGVTTTSEGEEPRRRVVILPADD